MPEKVKQRNKGPNTRTPVGERKIHTHTQTNIGTAEQADKTLNKLKHAKQNPRKYAYKHAITHTHTHLHVDWKDKNHVPR